MTPDAPGLTSGLLGRRLRRLPGRLTAPLAIVVLTTIVSLGGVAWNRSADESTITLTERELTLPYAVGPDDSGLSLRLDWQAPVVVSSSGYRGIDVWFDEAKLRALGFETSVPPDRADALDVYGRMLARDAFVVFELDGDAWRRRFEGRVQHAAPEYERHGVDRDRIAGSRLAPVDVGPHVAPLRARYPDRARYLILAAVVEPRVETVDTVRRLVGQVRQLFPDAIHVPRQHRAVLDVMIKADADARASAANRGHTPKPPRYAVRVRIGRRLEPWIESVWRIP